MYVLRAVQKESATVKVYIYDCVSNRRIPSGYEDAGLRNVETNVTRVQSETYGRRSVATATAEARAVPQRNGSRESRTRKSVWHELD